MNSPSSQTFNGQVTAEILSRVKVAYHGSQEAEPQIAEKKG